MQAPVKKSSLHQFLAAVLLGNERCYFKSTRGCSRLPLCQGQCQPALSNIYSGLIFPYFHGFHTSFPVNPNVPSSSFIVSLLTSAKVEKYIAALDYSPASNANIFMSLGSSQILNLTSMEVPLQSKEN